MGVTPVLERELVGSKPIPYYDTRQIRDEKVSVVPFPQNRSYRLRWSILGPKQDF